MGPIDAFAALVASLEYPMWIVTVDDGRERAGCLIGFSTQCSIHPPRFIACVSKLNHTFGPTMNAELLVVHLVGEDQRHLAELFGGETGDDVDKFEHCAWHPGPDGRTPVLDDCDRWFAGRVLDRVDAGDHVAVLLEPVEVHPGHDQPQLGYQELKDMNPGHPA